MTDVTHTNDTTVTSFEYNLKCRNFYDIEFSQKATTRLCFPLFFKIFIIPYLFYFFCSLFFFQHADVHATACWRIGSYAPDHSFPLFVVLFCFVLLFFLWGSALFLFFIIYLMYCKIHTTVALTYLR